MEPNSNSNSDAARVYAAVVEGKSAAELRAVIDEIEAGGEQRRLAALNEDCDRLVGDNAHAPDETPPPRHIKTELPLAAARRLRRNDLICVLVELGAAVEPVFGPGATPLAVCVACDDDDTGVSVRALLQGGAKARAPVGFVFDRHWPYCYFSQGERRFQECTRTCTAAHLCVVPPYGLSASFAPRRRCLEALVREGGAPDDTINAVDSDGLTPLAWLGHARGQVPDAAFLPTLLDLGADVKGRGRGADAGPPPFMYWFSEGYDWQEAIVACLRVLRDAGASFSGGVFDAEGYTPLSLAAAHGLVEVVRWLLDHAHADVHEPNRVTGALPLTCCSMEKEMVSALLEAGADANRADGQGRRPILSALSQAFDPEPGAALALLRAGAKIDGVLGPRGETPLMAAAMFWPPYCLSDDRTRLLEELLRRTSPADRRATLERGGWSAIDFIAGDGEGAGGFLWADDRPPRDDILDLDELPGGGGDMNARILATNRRACEAARCIVAELVIAGAPFDERHRDDVDDVIAWYAVPMAAERAGRATRELATRRSEERRWRAHDCMVQLAFDQRDVRDADARLEATRARLAALERAVAEAEEGRGGSASGGGTADEDDEDEDDEEEEEEEDDDE